MLQNLKRIYWHRYIVGVLSVVILWNLLFSFEAVKDKFPLLLDFQLVVHRFLYWVNPHPQYVNVVRVVPISDKVHWVRFSGDCPTDRRFLANLIRNAVAGPNRPSVIVLDVVLKAPVSIPGSRPSDFLIVDSQKRTDENNDLLGAIRTATDSGVPLVLAEGLSWNESKREFQREQSIFGDAVLPLRKLQSGCDLPACVEYGQVNVPLDIRQIPLRASVLGRDGSSNEDIDSLALVTATAYDEKTAREPKTVAKPIIKDAIEGSRREFVFGGFLPASAFPTIDAEALERSDVGAMRKCSGCILLVGGDWHAFPQERGPLFDGYDTPAGEMSGVFLHANYIEDLLDNRFQRPVSFWAAFGFDLVFALLLYAVHQEVRGPKSKRFVLGIFAALLFAVYFFFVNLNYYMDFVLPLGLCFVHLVYDHVGEYIVLRRRPLQPVGGLGPFTPVE